MSLLKIYRMTFKISMAFAFLSCQCQGSFHVDESVQNFVEFTKGRIKPRKLQQKIKQLHHEWNANTPKKITKGSHTTYHTPSTRSVTVVRPHGKHDRTYSHKTANKVLSTIYEALGTPTIKIG